MNKKKKLILLVITILILAILGVYFFLINANNNFIMLNYSEIKEKVDNKESFILCVSRTYCEHCNNYKPKLKDISNKYNIKIYYIELDKFNDNEVDWFKDKISFDGGTPVTIFIKNGGEVTTSTRIEGDVSKEKIISKLKTNGFIE